MTVWIQNPFDNLPEEGYRKQRYRLMADAFIRAGHEVVLFTSDFSHSNKRKRLMREAEAEVEAEVETEADVEAEVEAEVEKDSKRTTASPVGGDPRAPRNIDETFRVNLIPTPTYSRNISLRRVWSHLVYAWRWYRLGGALAAEKAKVKGEGEQWKASLIIASSPTISGAIAAILLGRKFGAKTVIDIQDAWPETFYRLAPRGLGLLVRLALSPLRLAARWTYRHADLVTGVCDRYRALCGRDDYYRAYLGIGGALGDRPLSVVGGALGDRAASSVGRSPRDRRESCHYVYAGAMGRSYDLSPWIRKVEADDSLTLDIASNGHVATDCPRIRQHGYLDADALKLLFARCDTGVIPMTDDSYVGIPNKFFDYAAAGLRIESSLGGECQALCERWNAALERGDTASLLKEIDATEIYDAYVAVVAGRPPYLATELKGNMLWQGEDALPTVGSCLPTVGRCLVVLALTIFSFATLFAEPIVFSNQRFELTIGENAVAKSLKLKQSGEELLANAKTPIFSVTQARPYNNEIKLIYANKRTTYPANRLRREGDKLIVGFKTIPYEAEVAVKLTDDYLVFTLNRYLVDKEDYDYLKMDTPPAKEFRVLALAVSDRENFGDWLNCAWDRRAAVAVVGTSPYTLISHEDRDGYRLLYGELLAGKRMRGGAAALIVARGREDFLDAMDAFERDFKLPRGVKNRRNPLCGASIYHESGGVTPKTVDDYIAIAKEGGFRCLTLSDTSIVKASSSWGRYGDYDLRGEYPNGLADVRTMLAKIHASGIKVGLHILHSHVGFDSRYVTPHCDARLNLKQRFTLARPLPQTTNDCEIAVLEDTDGAAMFPPCRLLRFGTELISYESYTAEPPYVFKGCRRGAWKTEVVSHPRGESGGILDVSEFGAPRSCYVNQDNDLQDEIAEKIAAIYNCGFDYVYLDGSEGVNEPFDINIALAQYRVWKRLEPEPFCAEGAAKTHFGWHMLSGANAFDIFPPALFKAKLMEFPCAQAPLSWQDMTRVDFGWWNLAKDTTPDLWEFGEAKATGWDCAASFLFSPSSLRKHRYGKELLEVVRRWEDAKAAGFFTPERKALLRDPMREFRLIRNPDGNFALNEIKE